MCCHPSVGCVNATIKPDQRKGPEEPGGKMVWSCRILNMTKTNKQTNKHGNWVVNMEPDMYHALGGGGGGGIVSYNNEHLVLMS